MPVLDYSQSTHSSQDTASGTSAGTSTGAGGVLGQRKRSYEEEIEDELDAFFDDEDVDASASRTTLMERPKARMKTRGNGAVGLVRRDSDFDDTDCGFLEPMDMDQ